MRIDSIGANLNQQPLECFNTVTRTRLTRHLSLPPQWKSMHTVLLNYSLSLVNIPSVSVYALCYINCPFTFESINSFFKTRPRRPLFLRVFLNSRSASRTFELASAQGKGLSYGQKAYIFEVFFIFPIWILSKVDSYWSIQREPIRFILKNHPSKPRPATHFILISVMQGISLNSEAVNGYINPTENDVEYERSSLGTALSCVLLIIPKIVLLTAKYIHNLLIFSR